MSRLKELIDRLCPDGVEYKKLGDILDYEQPTLYIVKSTEYDESYDTPVLTAGQTFILGYTDEKNGIYEADKNNPTIIFDDFTTSFHWVDFNFKVKSSAIKILKPKPTFKGSFRYIFYAMECINFEATTHARHWISKYSLFEIPLPPLPVQEEIVKVLDRFAEYAAALQAELQAELQARKEQYEYYRNLLLTFNSSACGCGTDDDQEIKVTTWGGRSYDIAWKTMGDICRNMDKMRKPITAAKRKAGSYPYYGASGIVDYVDNYIFDGEYLLISEDGANLKARSMPIAFPISGKCWVNNHAHVLKFENQYTQKFIQYYINMINISKYISGAAQPKLNQENLNSIRVPIPPLELQKKIVAILDRFETLVNDLTQGLPAEIKAVQEQYEYYRNKLLSFPMYKLIA